MLDLNKKTILVSIRRIDESGQESFDTFFGDVISFNANTVQLQRHDGGEIAVPYDEEVYEPAAPGFYELKNGVRLITRTSSPSGQYFLQRLRQRSSGT